MKEQELVTAIRTFAPPPRGAALDTAAPDTLLRFREDLLSDEEREQLLEQAVHSSEITRALLDARRFPDLEPVDEDELLSDDDVTRSWQRFQERLEREPVREPEPRPLPGPTPRRRRSAFLSPHLLRAAAAVLLLSNLGLGAALVLSRSDPSALRPRLNLPIVELVPESEQTRGERLAMSPDADGIVLVLTLGDRRSYPGYVVEIRDANAEILWSSSALRRAPEGILTLELPRGFLDAGRYRLVLRGQDVEQLTEVATYSLVIGE